MRALIVIDVQNDFCPGGALPVAGGDLVVPTINRLQQSFEHVILTQDWHPAGHASFASVHDGLNPFDVTDFPYGPQVLWPDHCIQGTGGAAFHPALETDKAELMIRKGFREEIDSYSAFFENDKKTATGLAGYLKDRSITSLFVAGLALDFCVCWSALDGRRMGFDVTVIQDASRAIDTNGSLDAAMQQMQDTQVGFTTSDQL